MENFIIKSVNLFPFSSNRSVNVSKQTEVEPQKNILGSRICAQMWPNSGWLLSNAKIKFTEYFYYLSHSLAYLGITWTFYSLLWHKLAVWLWATYLTSLYQFSPLKNTDNNVFTYLMGLWELTEIMYAWTRCKNEDEWSQIHAQYNLLCILSTIQPVISLSPR